MIESPVIQELIADCRGEDVVQILVARFGAEAKELEGRLKAVDEDRLDCIITLSAIHASLCALFQTIPPDEPLEDALP